MVTFGSTHSLITASKMSGPGLYSLAVYPHQVQASPAQASFSQGGCREPMMTPLFLHFSALNISSSCSPTTHEVPGFGGEEEEEDFLVQM